MFDPLSNLASLILSFREVRFDLLSVTQVIGDDSVNIRQGRRRIPLNNRLWGCAILERSDDKLQEDTRGADAQGAGGVLVQRRGISSDHDAHGTTSVNSHLA